MATHSSILAWRIPMDGGAWRATVPGVVAHSTAFSKAIDLRKAPLHGDSGFLSQQHPCPALHVYHGFPSQQDSLVITTAICLSGKHLYFCLGEASLVFTGFGGLFCFVFSGGCAWSGYAGALTLIKQHLRLEQDFQASYIALISVPTVPTSLWFWLLPGLLAFKYLPSPQSS